MSKLISLDSLRVVLQNVKNALTVLNNSISTKEKDLKEYVDIKTADINVSTPDWNTKEGEDGYIKNRTHFFSATSTVSPMAWEIDNTSTPKKATVNLSEDYIYMFEYNNNTYYIKTNTDKDTNKKLVDSGALSIYYKYVSGKHTIEIRHYSQDLTNTFLVIHEQSISSAISLRYLKQLDDIFIPDTIARKTDVEGFDPVIWKYICDPFVLQTGRIVPDELLNEAGNDFKYKLPGMYRWACGFANYDGSLKFFTGNENTDHWGTVILKDNKNIEGGGNELTSLTWEEACAIEDYMDEWHQYFVTGQIEIDPTTKRVHCVI